MMKTVIALALSMSGGGATAQGWTGYNGTTSGPGIARQLGKIDGSIRDARRTGQVSRREARHLRRENAQIGVLDDRYAAGGVSASERAELQTRVEIMRSNVDAARSQPRR